MSAAPRDWTPSQLEAIRTTGKAVLVSAAAGSGKTAALSERCVHLVFDATPPCDVDQLLVVTFTKTAASEMCERIVAAVQRRVDAEDPPSPRSERQLRLVDRATITTLDSFCLQLVRDSAHALGIDPASRLLDEDEATLLRLDTGQAMLERLFNDDASGLFRRLINEQCNGSDATLLSRVIRCHDLLNSVVDAERWLDDALKLWHDAQADLRESTFGKTFARLQHEVLDSGREAFDAAMKLCVAAGADAYVDHVNQCVAGTIGVLAPLIAERKWSELAKAMEVGLSLPRLPTIKNATDEVVSAKKAINDAKDLFKEGRALQLLRWSDTDLRSVFNLAAPLAAEFVRVVRVFRDAFGAAKRRLRALDFGDVETLALQVLRQPTEPLAPSDVALSLRKRFAHVLVDEYQDINPLQDAMLQLISTDLDPTGSPANRSNFFAVGDVKQSIYGFRLAEPKQFLNRMDRLRSGPSEAGAVISLRENFRSRAGVLDAVNAVFERIMTRETAGLDYDESNALRPKLKFPDEPLPQLPGKPVEVLLLHKHESDHVGADDEQVDDLDAFEREALLIASRAKELVESRVNVFVKSPGGGDSMRPIAYRDMAVLLRAARVKASQVADMLRRRGVPVYATDPTGFFDAVEVQDLLSLLRVLSNPRVDVPLAALLRSPLLSINDAAERMARVRVAFPHGTMSFADAIHHYAQQRDDEVASVLREAILRIDRWRTLVTRRPLIDGLEIILAETRYLSFLRGMKDGAQRVANVESLLMRASQFSSFERQGLDRFLRFIDQLQREDDLGQPASVAEGTDAVRVMTVHRSKGLEFPVVFVPDMGKAANDMSLREPILLERSLGVGLHGVDISRRAKYPTLATLAIDDALRRAMVAEELRVLYVALTRAREHLILIGTDKPESITQSLAALRGMAGPMSAQVVRRAKSPLQWVLPVAGVSGPALFKVERYDSARLSEVSKAFPEVESITPLDPRIASLVPLKVDVPPDDVTRQIERRLTWSYAFAPLADVESRRSMSEHDAAEGRDVRDDLAAIGVAAPTPHPSDPKPGTLLAFPRFAEESSRGLIATDIGTATHAVLQYLDFGDAHDESAVERQIARMVERVLLSPAQARLVDRSAVVWVAQSDAGRLLAPGGARRVWRERDLALRVSPTSLPGNDAIRGFDPARLTREDQVLLRGRVDAMALANDGSLVVIDYKTDRVTTDEQIAARVSLYEPQVRAYADAIGTIVGAKVARTVLAFLTPRQLRDVR
jgi:ATP-dependent helicase/nuclease subunit A